MSITKEMMDEINRINSDVEVLKNCSAGSNALTFLIKNDGSLRYRKIAVQDKVEVEKLHDQLVYTLRYNEELKFPKIMAQFYSPDACWYDMYTANKCMSMFEFINTHSTKASWEILKKVLDRVRNFHTTHKLPFKKENLDSYIENKTLKNVEKIKLSGGKFIEKLQNFDEIIINGKSYKNLPYYFGNDGIITREFLYETFKNDMCSNIHGDFTLENIICTDEAEDGYYLIDPTVNNLHETALLDFAVMLQSLHAKYESIREIKEVKIKDNSVNFEINVSKHNDAIYKKYEEYLYNNFDIETIKSIYFHEIIHWIRLMPYKIKKDEKTATAYYCELLILLDEVTKRF